MVNALILFYKFAPVNHRLVSYRIPAFVRLIRFAVLRKASRTYPVRI